MTESDEANSCNGSGSCCSSQMPQPPPPLLSGASEHHLAGPAAVAGAVPGSGVETAAGHSSENLHHPLNNSDHVKVIPSLHTTIPNGYKYLQVHTLTKETITLAVHMKCRVQDAYLCCCAHLGFDEERLFGLALRTPSEGIGGDRPRNEYFFLDPSRKITKYAPKQWKISHAWNTVVESRPFLALHLRVRIYVDKVQIIRCPTVLRHYYLQLRENLQDQWSGPNSVAEGRCWELAALALHADENGNDLLSFRAEQYFPLWVVNIHGLDFVRRNMPAVREDLRSCSSNDAVIEYCQQASRSPFALNCHLYGLRRHKMDTFDNAVIGISPKGIETSDVGSDGERIPLRKLQWNRIAKLSFDKRKVTITGVDGVSLSLYAQFESKARYLLEFCKAFHQATMFINNQLAFRQNCSTSISSPLFCADEMHCLDDALSSRRSLNSRASSNSTSGVVSDKPGSEADKDCEWTDACGVASDCSCEETQPFTVGDLTAEVDKASLRAVPKVVAASVQDEGTNTESDSVDVEGRSNTSARSKEITSSEKSTGTVEEKTNFVSSSSSSSSSCSSSGHAVPEKTRNMMQEVRNMQEEAEIADSTVETVAKKRSFTDSTSSSATSISNAPTKVNCCIRKDICVKTDEATETTEEFEMDLPLKQPPLYTEAMVQTSQVQQSRLEVAYQRPNLNPNIKPRWFTVAGVGTSGAATALASSGAAVTAVSCPLETTTHLAYSEPKLHYQVYTRSGSPLTSLPTTSYQSPVVATSPRPPPFYTPPPPSSVIQPGTNGGLFQKRHGQRLPHAAAVRGISRVQSMPAHSSQHYLVDDELSAQCSMAAVSIKHSNSSPGTRFPVYTKQPPPYEHAILQQARARYAQKTAMICPPHSSGLPKDILSERHSYTSEQEEMALNSRIRQYPMMRALWQEHQQGSCGQLATSSSSSSSASQLGVPSVSNPMLSSLNAVIDDSATSSSEAAAAAAQLQRPSSCQELSSPMLVTTPPHFTSTPTYEFPAAATYATRLSGTNPGAPIYRRELYVPELSPPTCYYYSPYAAATAGRNQLSWVMSHSVLDLPPPPPYPPPRCPPSPTVTNATPATTAATAYSSQMVA